jgi:hypothetical protein
VARKPSPNKIKTHRIYTVWEAADALDRHRQSIIRWIKEKSLIADTSRKPWLITGQDLKTFLGHQRRKSRCALALHHLYCLGCKMPQEPAGKFADYFQQSATSGMLKALCPACGCVMNKVIRRADLEAVRAKIEVTIQQADPRLVSLDAAPSNVTFSDEAKPHVKTHI